MYEEGLADIMNGQVTFPEAVDEDVTAAQKRAYGAEKKEHD